MHNTGALALVQRHEMQPSLMLLVTSVFDKCPSLERSVVHNLKKLNTQCNMSKRHDLYFFSTENSYCYYCTHCFCSHIKGQIHNSTTGAGRVSGYIQGNISLADGCCYMRLNLALQLSVTLPCWPCIVGVIVLKDFSSFNVLSSDQTHHLNILNGLSGVRCV